MEPGPELDALVAEKVMGWNRGRGFAWNWYNRYGHKVCDHRDWEPSTNIEDAWEVVEKLLDGKEETFTVEIITSCSGAIAQVFDDGFEVAQSFAPDVAHAICLAALRAVGVGVR